MTSTLNWLDLVDECKRKATAFDGASKPPVAYNWPKRVGKPSAPSSPGSKTAAAKSAGGQSRVTRTTST